MHLKKRNEHQSAGLQCLHLLTRTTKKRFVKTRIRRHKLCRSQKKRRPEAPLHNTLTPHGHSTQVLFRPQPLPDQTCTRLVRLHQTCTAPPDLCGSTRLVRLHSLACDSSPAVTQFTVHDSESASNRARTAGRPAAVPGVVPGVEDTAASRSATPFCGGVCGPCECSTLPRLR